MNSVADAVFYLLIIGVLLGILIDEKERKVSLLICCALAFMLLIEVSKNFSVGGYGYILILITMAYGFVLVFAIFLGIVLNRSAKNKAKKIVNGGKR